MDASALAGEVARQIISLVEGTQLPQQLRDLIFGYLRKPAKVLEGEAGMRWGLLPVLSAQACGGSWEPAVPAGAAVEFFVAAGDVLDDLADMDTVEAQSPLVRPALPNVAASLLMLTEQAVLLLQASGADASRVLSVSRAFAEAGLRAASGQFLDLEYERASSIGVEECLAMTELKSGSLASCACQVGALVATADPALLESCARFGRNLGTAAQLLNDVHGLWAEDLDKSDVRRRKKTLPVVYGLRWARGRDAKLLRDVYQSVSDLTSDQVARVRDVLWKLGAMYYSSAMVDIYRQRARGALQSFPPSPSVDVLLELARSTEGG